MIIWLAVHRGCGTSQSIEQSKHSISPIQARMERLLETYRNCKPPLLNDDLSPRLQFAQLKLVRLLNFGGDKHGYCNRYIGDLRGRLNTSDLWIQDHRKIQGADDSLLDGPFFRPSTQFFHWCPPALWLRTWWSGDVWRLLNRSIEANRSSTSFVQEYPNVSHKQLGSWACGHCVVPLAQSNTADFFNFFSRNHLEVSASHGKQGPRSELQSSGTKYDSLA